MDVHTNQRKHTHGHAGEPLALLNGGSLLNFARIKPLKQTTKHILLLTSTVLIKKSLTMTKNSALFKFDIT